MARRISVELVGDAASLERAFLDAGKAATSFAATSTRASNKAVEARIAASAKQISALRADSEAFATASASYVKGSDEQIAASKLLVDTQRRLQVAMGETATSTRRTGASAATAEREVGRFSRGALAGTGVIRGLGRSLAFASGGFLAFAGFSTLLRNSITGAESLEKAQRSLDVAIQHTGGDLAILGPQYATTAKNAAQFGISQADATRGLARATVLTGDAAKAQRAYQEALVISKATGKDFNAVLTATSKGQEGVTTSLQRYGILIAKGTPGQVQFQAVMGRFAGQAQANTSGIDRFNATLANTEAIIGRALLPVLNKYLGELGRWLDKMNRSGRLQHDVNAVVRTGTAVFRGIGHAIRTVDRFTGSFKHTLELLIALRLASKFSRWTGALDVLAGTAGGGGLRGAEVQAARLLTKMRALAGLGVITVEVVLFEHFIQKYGLKNTLNAGLDPTATLGPGVADDQTITVKGKTYPIGTGAAFAALVAAGWKPPKGVTADTATARMEIDAAKSLGGSASIPPPPARHHHRRRHHRGAVTSGSASTPTVPASARPHRRATHDFELPFRLRLAQAKADATLTLRDDLRVAREERRYILSRIPHLHGQKLIDAYELLGQVNQTIAADVQRSAKHAKKAHHAAAKMADAFHELDTRSLTADLGLTVKQRKELRARLSRIGPGGTVPGSGVGAGGYIIGDNGRPIHIHNTVELDGKPVARNTTKHQQKHHRRNPGQRRGPHAGRD